MGGRLLDEQRTRSPGLAVKRDLDGRMSVRCLEGRPIYRPGGILVKQLTMVGRWVVSARQQPSRGLVKSV